MARITVEDCLTRETNRFALVQLASKRTKQILRGAKTVLTGIFDNKAVVMALREVADGKVRFMTETEAQEAALKAEAEKQVIVPAPIVPASADPFITSEPVAAVETPPNLNGDNLF